MEELPPACAPVMEFCDQFSRKVGGEGCLEDRLGVLSNQDGSGDVALAREAALYIAQQLIEQSRGLKDRTFGLIEAWSRVRLVSILTARITRTDVPSPSSKTSPKPTHTPSPTYYLGSPGPKGSAERKTSSDQSWIARSALTGRRTI